MSADSLRSKGGGGGGVVMTNTKVPGHTVRPQPVSEKTFMESVAGLINEVGLTPQPYGHAEDADNMVVWAKFESPKAADLKGLNWKSDNAQQLPPLLLAVGYPCGVQMWTINVTGDANEILSWKRPQVKQFQLLPTPTNEDRDQHKNSRPIAAICEGSGTTNFLTFISLKSGESLKSSKFIQSVLDILVNSVAIAVSFLDKIIVVDPFTLETKVTISQLGTIPTAPTHNPLSLGPTWLAYTDRRLFPRYQSGGGMEMGGSLSYTASMLSAAKSLTKGLKGLGETVASSITGNRPPGRNENVAQEPGIVTIINLTDLKPGEFCLSDTSTGNSAMAPVIAHFVAHRQSPVTSLSFDPSGMLVVTADKQGHDFNVFRIQAHPLSSALGSVAHLYILHRGDTVAKVQNISFAPDSRWVAVSTLRGTTHVFPITPYGGPISARTHNSHKVVNRLSRFHRTAGLDDTSGRQSPGPVTAFGSNPSTAAVVVTGIKSTDLSQSTNSFAANNSLSHPLTITPMAQLRQDSSGLTSSSSPRSSPPVSKAKTFLQEERSIVVSVFSEPRSQAPFNPAIVQGGCDKRKKTAIDSLFVMTCFGNLIEYLLDPKPCTDSLQRSSAHHGKVSDDTPIELSVHAKAQWKLMKPSFIKELQPPLQPNNMLIVMNSLSDAHMSSKNPPKDENSDERWLSQVEITTHHGPHRRLWMGPQFTFKVFNPSLVPGTPKTGVHDIETVEVNVTNRPARSNPVNMPVYSSLLPFVIEDSSGSSLEQSPRLVDPYCQSDAMVVNNDSHIKENIAEAMMENANLNSRETGGGCQSQTLGSCDDLSSGSSIDSSSHGPESTSGDAPLASSFCIDAGFPFPD